MAGEINTTAVIAGLLPALHADSVANLTFWSQADLVNWMDEGLKRLARVAGVFVERDTSITTANGTATYALPERQDTTLYVSLGTAPLRPASMLELEMRDSGFQSTPGTPDHWYEDGQGWNIGLSPVPTGAATVAMIMAAWPPTLDTGQVNTLVQAPAPLAGYLTMYTLAKAYGREGESEMPDVARHCAGRCEMYEQIFQKYYGAGL
jgi:hypothetical protein